LQVRARRKAREAALRALYQLEITRSLMEEGIQDTLEHAELSSDLAEFMQTLVRGVRHHQNDLDELLASLITDWDYDRVAPIDRNLLRIGAFELLHLPQVPPAVSINEAVELAKKYSTAESGKFVNGVLGKLLAQSPKAKWDPATAPEEEPWVEAAEPEPEAVVEEVAEDSPEAEELRRVGLWRLRA